jgi:K+-sensing histidine kinase KdpD
MGPPSAIIFLVAIIASAWIGGVGPGLLTSVTLHIAHGYLFIDPPGLWESNIASLVSTGGYYVVGIIVGVLSQKRASALARARAEHTDAVAQRERLRATLGCIADGVIVTNTRPLASWSAGCLEIASRPQSRPYY